MEPTIQELHFLDHKKYHEKWEEKKHLKRNYCPLVYELYDEVQLLTAEEFGRLVIADLYYSVTGEIPELPGNERYLFNRVKLQEDNFQKYYADQAAKRSQKAKKASDAARAKRLDALSHLEISQDVSRYQEEPCTIHNTNTNTNTNPNTNPNTNTKSNTNSNSNHSLSMSSPRDPDRTARVAGGDGEERDYKNERKGDTMMQEGREFARVIAMVENCCGKPVGESVRGEIAGFVRSLGEDMIVCALDRAAAYQSRNWGYIRSILQNWEREGVRTPESCRSPVEIGQSREQRSAGYSHCNSPDMYQTHRPKKLSQLELEAIREALEDDDDDYDYPGADRS